jgi:hypothetical protein
MYTVDVSTLDRQIKKLHLLPSRISVFDVFHYQICSIYNNFAVTDNNQMSVQVVRNILDEMNHVGGWMPFVSEDIQYVVMVGCDK